VTFWKVTKTFASEVELFFFSRLASDNTPSALRFASAGSPCCAPSEKFNALYSIANKIERF
jgi:hypothetical protein